MGASSSRSTHDAAKTASDLFFPVVAKIQDQGSGVKPGTAGLVTYIMTSLTLLDDSVLGMIRGAESKMLDENYLLLDAYYEATEKAKEAALNIQTHVSNAIVEVSRLRAVLERVGDGASQALALEELKLVNTERMNLPRDILDDLNVARTAYEKVIKLCDAHLEQQSSKQDDRRVWAWMGVLVGVTAIVVLTPFLGPPLLPALCLGADTAVALSALVFVGAAGITTISTLAIMRICELQKFLVTLKQQRELLATAQGSAEKIIVHMQEVQLKVQRAQADFGVLSNATGTAQRFQSLAELQEEEFLEDVKQQLADLRDLKKTCRKLMDNVIKAYQIFKEKSSVIRTRILGGYKDKVELSQM